VVKTGDKIKMGMMWILFVVLIWMINILENKEFES